MDFTKSAGSDGYARGYNKKGDFLVHDLDLVKRAAWSRLQRLVLVGQDIGLFTGPELVRYGLRGAVFPAIKDEWHEERKVLQMKDGKPLLDDEGNRIRVADPRWRSILMQSTVEYVVQYCLFKRQVNAQVEVLQNGSIDRAIAQSSVVGISTTEPGLQRLREIVDRMREKSGGKLRTSDITGLDWSVGALGGSHGFLTILSAETWSSYNSVYHVGKSLYAQTGYGTVQTGMLCTSQEGGSARLIDAILRWGVRDLEGRGIEPHCPCICYSDVVGLARALRNFGLLDL